MSVVVLAEYRERRRALGQLPDPVLPLGGAEVVRHPMAGPPKPRCKECGDEFEPFSDFEEFCSETCAPKVFVSPPPARKTPRKPRARCGGLQFYPRLNRWKASNVSLDPARLKAWSYDWWLMLDRIGGIVVLNEYGYSNSTRKHQAKVRSWLWQNSIDFVTIESPKGLQDLESAERFYLGRISDLEKAISKPRTRATTNERRREEISILKHQLEFTRRLKKLQRKERAS